MTESHPFYLLRYFVHTCTVVLSNYYLYCENPSMECVYVPTRLNHLCNNYIAYTRSNLLINVLVKMGFP